MSVTMFTSSTKMYFKFWTFLVFFNFVTTAKKYNVDEYAIKYMIGHEISDVTEKVYTKRDESWLHTEIEKIK